jgi:hypothetical protein
MSCVAEAAANGTAGLRFLLICCTLCWQISFCRRCFSVSSSDRPSIHTVRPWAHDSVHLSGFTEQCETGCLSRGSTRGELEDSATCTRMGDSSRMRRYGRLTPAVSRSKAAPGAQSRPRPDEAVNFGPG